MGKFFRKLKRNRYLAFIFLVEAICMAMELCASRTLSPYFGDSNIVWTSIIGVILAGASIGNTIGGRLADRMDPVRALRRTVTAASACILYIPVFSDIILSLLSSAIPGVKAGAVLGTVALFLPSSLLFGTVPPLVTKLELERMDHAGRVSGRIHALSTLGGITGTFAGGFLLVPAFGCDSILLGLAIVTAFLSLAAGGKLKHAVLVAAICAACIRILAQAGQENEDAVAAGVQDAYATFDTQYGRVQVTNGTLDGEAVRYMVIGDGCESATYLDEDLKYELPVAYTRYYDLMYASGEVESALMLGGGGYSYPEYCVSHYGDTSMTVVEIDGDVTELAMEYFFLDDALEEYGDRLSVVTEDAKVYLGQTEETYDAILNDSFSGLTPAETLTTVETVTQIHGLLNPGGVYLTNIIGSREGDGSGFLLAEANTISQVFRYVYIVPCLEEGESLEEISPSEVRNHMVIGSDEPLDIEGAVDVDYSSAIILTDDYNPVDALVPDIDG